MKEKNKTYTAADFERYHSGTMPAAEMHALEKAALNDHFIEDALEGYSHIPATESDIVELRARLAEKSKKKNIFFISSFAQNKWWRIAAVFIIMTGGILFYQLNYVGKKNSLAKNEIKTSVAKENSTAGINGDTVASKNEVAFEDEPVQKHTQKDKITMPVAKQRIEKKVISPGQNTHLLSSLYPAAKAKNNFYSDSASFRKLTKKIDAQVKGYVLKGKVTDEEGNAVPYASITANIHGKGTVADTAGRFFLRAQDSSVAVTASAPGYTSKSFMMKKDAEPIITMNKSNTELNEATVTAVGRDKQFREPALVSKELKKTVSRVQTAPSGPRPLGGQEKFDLYLKENTAPVYNENNELLTGEVLLSFTINKKGRPRNIKVLRSSCEPCEPEAIQLLQNGPYWTARENTPATVVIKF